MVVTHLHGGGGLTRCKTVESGGDVNLPFHYHSLGAKF